MSAVKSCLIADSLRTDRMTPRYKPSYEMYNKQKNKPGAKKNYVHCGPQRSAVASPWNVFSTEAHAVDELDSSTLSRWLQVNTGGRG